MGNPPLRSLAYEEERPVHRAQPGQTFTDNDLGLTASPQVSTVRVFDKQTDRASGARVQRAESHRLERDERNETKRKGNAPS